MSARTLRPTRPSMVGTPAAPSPIIAALRSLWQREPRLVAFALILLVLLLPAAIGLGLDERTLRGVNVWIKPMKFMLSVSLLALTTAWFAAHLLPQARRSRSFTALVWTLIATGGFEVGYITLQAALGQASHYNVSDAVHGALYTLMGGAALAMTATQPWLAYLIWRHGQPGVAPAYRLSVLLGLVLTFALGATVGILLGGGQPPVTEGLPVLGWSRSGGDLRVAHFVGIHAGQVLPLIGCMLATCRVGAATAGVWAVSLAWTGLWAATLAQAVQGRPLIGL
ncbi:MAG: hypothetical protein V4795_05475 [Pseudomonadota bacterium]